VFLGFKERYPTNILLKSLFLLYMPVIAALEGGKVALYRSLKAAPGVL
jgi:hypothetical protein